MARLQERVNRLEAQRGGFCPHLPAYLEEIGIDGRPETRVFTNEFPLDTPCPVGCKAPRLHFVVQEVDGDDWRNTAYHPEQSNEE